MAVREVDSYLQKNEGQSPTYIIYKNKFKVDKRLKHKSWHHRSLRGEQNFFLRCRQWSKTDCGGDSCTFGGRLIFILLLEFIGVILVNEIIYISSVQFYNTSSVHCIVCSPPKVKSPSTTIYPWFTLFYLPHLSLPLVIIILFSVSMNFSPLSLHLFHPASQPLSPLTAVSLFSISMSLFLFCLLVYSVH